MPPVLHDNHLMRFVPLIPSNFAPGPWQAFGAVELVWSGTLHGDWPGNGPVVHAVHLPALPWNGSLGDLAMAALRPRLDLDFLVLHASAPAGRTATAGFLSTLEGLLEITHGRGVKLALRPQPGTAGTLAHLLKEVRGEAVGFCWDRTVGLDLEAISDRLFCAVSTPGDNLRGLQALGYRWDVELPALDPTQTQASVAELERAFPTVYFPAGLEAPHDPAVQFGHHLEEPL